MSGEKSFASAARQQAWALTTGPEHCNSGARGSCLQRLSHACTQDWRPKSQVVGVLLVRDSPLTHDQQLGGASSTHGS